MHERYEESVWKIEWLIVAPARKPPARLHGISSGHNHPATSIQFTATEDWEQLNQHPPAAATEDWEQLNQHPPAALNRGYATPHRTTREELQQSNISWLTKEPLDQYAMQMQ
ncbi:3-phosphoinositide-dependent protein kinase-1 [Dorcoceras hygrometricum]|uniref:3-phosphoinositide-dependent protein kinase-1 n=1 Tax=Dorcoceras hygrometricum TaxID=472368 RepID=A0A2Z7ATV2_9LAMI|nr:3-phosphoinositide-dependent protein kinase-1 [Dorcoceras hygrometricum]